MRLSATILVVACCVSSLTGCCGHRSCWSKKHHRNQCVDQADWDDDDDEDRHHQCGCDVCDGGYGMQGMPMQSFDSGCGCGGGGGMSMPYFDGGMSMPMMSAPSSGCGCNSGGGGMMSSPYPSYPTYSNPVMMQPMAEPTPTPTPAQAPPASVPATESYYSPSRGASTPTVPASF